MGPTLLDWKSREIRCKQVSVHMAIYAWHLKTHLPSFRANLTVGSIIDFSFSETNSRKTELTCKYVPQSPPRELIWPLLNFPRVFWWIHNSTSINNRAQAIVIKHCIAVWVSKVWETDNNTRIPQKNPEKRHTHVFSRSLYVTQMLRLHDNCDHKQLNEHLAHIDHA